MRRLRWPTMLDELKEAGLAFEVPPELAELMARRENSRWRQHRMRDGLLELRARQQGS